MAKNPPEEPASSSTVKTNGTKQNGNGNGHAFTHRSLKEIEKGHYEFHINELGTAPAIARKIARSIIEPELEELAMLRKRRK